MKATFHGDASDVRVECESIADLAALIRILAKPTPVHKGVPMQEHILQFFEFEHLPPTLQEISRPFHALAYRLVNKLPRNPERTTALRKLLEAKDCAVRAHIAREEIA